MFRMVLECIFQQTVWKVIMNFVLASKTLTLLLNGVPSKKCELFVNFRFIYFNILFYKTRSWFHHSHCMYGVFLKCLDKTLRQIIKPLYIKNQVIVISLENCMLVIFPRRTTPCDAMSHFLMRAVRTGFPFWRYFWKLEWRQKYCNVYVLA